VAADDERVSTPAAYWIAVSIGTMIWVSLCVACRRWPGPWVGWAGRAISVVLVADAVLFVSVPLAEGRWSVQASLPLALCDVALIVAAIACWWPRWLLAVELTYFWGLAGTLQAVVTPDLSAGFPQLEFFMFVVGHLGIVIAALFLVVGLRLTPRRGSVMRVFAITAAYTAFVGCFNWLTGSNYMYLAAVPTHGSLLSVLGPWPWYILSATGVALVLLLILDAPFHRRGLVRSNWAENRQRTRSGANRETAGEKDTAGKNGSNENA
jgi:hypothetical integral membrane protein (TIGR02206 family)